MMRATILCLAWLMLFWVEALSAKEMKRPPTGPLITVHLPHPKQYEIALDEIELEWIDRGHTAQAYAKTPTMIVGSRVVKSEASRAAVVVSGITSPMDLSMMAAALKAANPGAEAHLILYEPGLPRSKASRRLLTREVGVVLGEEDDPQRLFADVPVESIRSAPGVPGGYVVETSDPMTALNVADLLRQRPEVRSTYPLLKRTYFTR
jgi:hypothetical protein